MPHPDPRQNPPTKEALSILYDQCERRLEAIAEIKEEIYNDSEFPQTSLEEEATDMLFREESALLDLQSALDAAMEYLP